MAQNSIGSAALILSTNFGGMISGLQQAGTGITSWINSVQEKMFLMSSGITGAFSAFGLPATLGAQIQQVADSINHASKVGQSLGVLPENFIALERAAHLGGVGTEEFEKGVTKLARSQSQALGGNQEALASFQSLGISLQDLQTLSLDQLTMRTADGFRNIAGSAASVNTAMTLMGRGGAALLPLMNRGSQGIQELINRARELGTANLTGEQVNQIREMKGAWKQVGEAIQGIWTQLTAGFAPILTDIAKAFVDIWIAVQPTVISAASFINAGWQTVKVWIVGIAEAIQNIPEWLSNSLIGVGVFLAGWVAFGQVVAIISAIRTAIVALTAVMMRNPIFFIAGIIAAVVSAFVDWEAVIDAVKESFGTLESAMLSAAALAVEAWDKVLLVVEKVLDFLSIGGRLGDWASGVRDLREEVQGTATELTNASAQAARLRNTLNPPAGDFRPTPELQAWANSLQGDMSWNQGALQFQTQFVAHAFEPQFIERVKQIRELEKQLDTSFRTFGMSQDEQRLDQIRQLGATAEELRNLQGLINRNLGQQLERDADPLAQFNEQMERMTRAFESGNLSFEAFTRLRDRALEGAERALQVPEIRFANIATSGSAAQVEAQIRHQFGDTTLSPQERTNRLMEIANDLQTRANDEARRFYNQFAEGLFDMMNAGETL